LVFCPPNTRKDAKIQETLGLPGWLFFRLFGVFRGQIRGRNLNHPPSREAGNQGLTAEDAESAEAWVLLLAEQ
jgi:hypothetical protein